MRTLGLVGGTSWESTQVYYRLLNEGVRARLGGEHSARLVLWSADFADLAFLPAKGAWDEVAAILSAAAQAVERAGAEALMLCANTMHRVADEVQASVSIPLIHIADVAAESVKARGVRSPLLLATRFTMEEAFYRDRLKAHGVEVLTPDKPDRDRLHEIIYDELIVGVVEPRSRALLLDVIDADRDRLGIDGVILGCTEFGLLVGQQDVSLPLIDTTVVHAEAGVDFLLGDSSLP